MMAEIRKRVMSHQRLVSGGLLSVNSEQTDILADNKQLFVNFSWKNRY